MIDLDELANRLRAALPQLEICRAVLEHSQTRAQIQAITIESTEPRKKDHMYRMTVTSIDGEVHFFVHLHGGKSDLTTRGARHYSKECDSTDEVFAMVRSCWTGGTLS